MDTPNDLLSLVKRIKIITSILIFLLLLQTSLSDAEENQTMYVHSTKAPVYSQPNMNSEKVVELKSGMKIKVIEEKGYWYHIIHNENQGWIFKLMVRNKPPKNYREINVDQIEELASKARRRPSAYTTTAAARGLKSKRDRFATRYKTDYHALEKMESMAISYEEANNFLTNGE